MGLHHHQYIPQYQHPLDFQHQLHAMLQDEEKLEQLIQGVTQLHEVQKILKLLCQKYNNHLLSKPLMIHQCRVLLRKER